MVGITHDAALVRTSAAWHCLTTTGTDPRENVGTFFLTEATLQFFRCLGRENLGLALGKSENTKTKEDHTIETLGSWHHQLT